MTKEVVYVDSVDRAATLLKPLRIQLLQAMREARSCTDLAADLGETPQKIYYHVKKLEAAALVERAGERVINGISEGFYRARGRAYWLSPRLVQDLGGLRPARDATSLGILAQHAESMLTDVGALAERLVEGDHVPSLSLAVDIHLPTGDRRQQFMYDLETAFTAIAERYTADRAPAASCDADATAPFRFTLACYPTATSVTR